jgi:hypothetical protein
VFGLTLEFRRKVISERTLFETHPLLSPLPRVRSLAFCIKTYLTIKVSKLDKCNKF